MNHKWRTSRHSMFGIIKRSLVVKSPCAHPPFPSFSRRSGILSSSFACTRFPLPFAFPNGQVNSNATFVVAYPKCPPTAIASATRFASISVVQSPLHAWSSIVFGRLGAPTATKTDFSQGGPRLPPDGAPPMHQTSPNESQKLIL